MIAKARVCYQSQDENYGNFVPTPMLYIIPRYLIYLKRGIFLQVMSYLFRIACAQLVKRAFY